MVNISCLLAYKGCGELLLINRKQFCEPAIGSTIFQSDHSLNLPTNVLNEIARRDNSWLEALV
jgi:hypothetical protein